MNTTSLCIGTPVSELIVTIKASYERCTLLLHHYRQRTDLHVAVHVI